MCAMKRYSVKSKFTSKRKHSREKTEVFVMFSIAIDVQTLRKDAFQMSPAFSNSKAEFTKLTFANMAEKRLDQRKMTGVFFR